MDEVSSCNGGRALTLAEKLFALCYYRQHCPSTSPTCLGSLCGGQCNTAEFLSCVEEVLHSGTPLSAMEIAEAICVQKQYYCTQMGCDEVIALFFLYTPDLDIEALTRLLDCTGCWDSLWHCETIPGTSRVRMVRGDGFHCDYFPPCNKDSAAFFLDAFIEAVNKSCGAECDPCSYLCSADAVQFADFICDSLRDPGCDSPRCHVLLTCTALHNLVVALANNTVCSHNESFISTVELGVKTCMHCLDDECANNTTFVPGYCGCQPALPTVDCGAGFAALIAAANETSQNCRDRDLLPSEIADLICTYVEQCVDDCDQRAAVRRLLRENLGMVPFSLAQYIYTCIAPDLSNCPWPSWFPPIDPGQIAPGSGGGAGGSGPDDPRQSQCSMYAFIPVDLSTGYKTENVTDVQVSIPGYAYRLNRQYTSNPDSQFNGVLGKGWAFSAMQHLVTDSTSANLALVGYPLDHKVVFTPHPSITNRWIAPSPSTQYIDLVTGQSDAEGVTTTVLRLTEPGSWTKDFYALSGSTIPYPILAGLPISELDLYGNGAKYRYPPVTSADTVAPMPFGVELGNYGLSTPIVRAQVLFDLASQPSPSVAPRLGRVTVVRLDASGAVLGDIEQVDYAYKYSGDGKSADLGPDGQLVQVVHSTRVDKGIGSHDPFARTVTQYRYHSGSGSVTIGPGSGTTLSGAAGSLKSVLNPQQIEYFAQKWAVSTSATDPYDALTDAAAALMTRGDTAAASEVDSGFLVSGLAAKWVGYSSDRVTTELVQTSCGCGGGASHGLKVDFAYFAGSTDAWRTNVETQYQVSASGALTTFKKTYTDMIPVTGTWRVANKAVEDGADSSRRWVTHSEYDSNGDEIVTANPSVTSAYTPATSTTQAFYSPHTSSGVSTLKVYQDHRVTETWMGQGITTSGGVSISSPQLVTKTTYGGSGARPYLVSKIERYRVAGSTAADDIEETDYAYGFYGSSDRIASIQMTTERETVAENGPGGTVSTYALVDTLGQNRWACDAGRTLNYMEYDDVAGAMTKLVRNAPIAGSSGVCPALNGSDYGGISTSGWGRTGATLISTFVNDLLGRTKAETSPAGVTSYTTRELLTSSIVRPGLAYYASISLPFHGVVGTTHVFDGPASLTLYDASMASICSQEFALTGTSYDPLASPPVYTLGTETARSTTTHNVSGQVTSSKVWTQFAEGSPRNIPETSSTTTYTYDGLGRLSATADPLGTVSENHTYDIFGRVLSVYSGTTGSGTVEVARYYYDHILDGGGNPQQGSGRDGNLTLVKIFTGETGGTLGPADRTTERFYDERDRLVKVLQPATPHEVYAYDNLNRPTKRALLDHSPAGGENVWATTLTGRGLYTETQYSQRGLTYRQAVAVDPSDLSLGFLDSHSWYDDSGRTTASWGPNRGATKTLYDALGRVSEVYTTDHGSDADPGQTGNYANWGDSSTFLSGDRVFEQATFNYTVNDRLAFTTSRVRLHDASSSSYGVLTSSNSVSTVTGFEYDWAQRRSKTIAMGANSDGVLFLSGGTVPTTWPLSSYPSWALTTVTVYDAIGRVAQSKDPMGHITSLFYDNVDRRYATVENHTSLTTSMLQWDSTLSRWIVSGLSTPGADSSHDADRVTSYVYDAAGHMVKQTAHRALDEGGSLVDQVTSYEYGVGSATGSLIESFDLVKAAHYPDKTTGEPGSGVAYAVQYAYNLLGELRTVTDQNQLVHTYARDSLGRVLTDTVTFPSSLPSWIDDRIDQIAATYDAYGRLSKATSRIRTSRLLTGESQPANAVEFAYTPLWQIAQVKQACVGDTTGSNVRTVDYEYATLNAAPYLSTPITQRNYTRPSKLMYPSSGYPRTLAVYGYDANTEGLSRLDTMSIVPQTGASSYGTSIAMASYQFVGASTPVVTTLNSGGSVNVMLDRSLAFNGTHTSGAYPGLDNFGRVIRQTWAAASIAQNTSNGAFPNKPPLFSEGYEYDANSNRTARFDARPGKNDRTDIDQKFEYDGLDRLQRAKKGNYSQRTGTAWLKGPSSQEWVLDLLGNWTKLKNDKDSTPDWDFSSTADVWETRKHDAANQLTERDPDGSGSAPAQPFHYCDAGSIKDGLLAKTGSSETKHTYVHDAWNRLVQVKLDVTGSSTKTILNQQYNGLHWRTIKEGAPNSVAGTVPASPTEKRYFTYDLFWRVIEERIDDAFPTSPGVNRVQQLFWGTRYIDDLVARRTDRNADGDYDDSNEQLYWTLNDAQFSVRALINATTGRVCERVSYDAYGNARHSFPGDANGDGGFGSADLTELNTLTTNNTTSKAIIASDYNPDLDVNADGVIDSGDYSALGVTPTTGAFAVPMGSGKISSGGSNSSTPDGDVGYCGYMFNHETQEYSVRFRTYAPRWGRWIETDPLGYIDGGSLYEAARGSPVGSTDAFGLSITVIIDGTSSNDAYSDPQYGFMMDGRSVSICRRLHSELMAKPSSLSFYLNGPEDDRKGWRGLLRETIASQCQRIEDTAYRSLCTRWCKTGEPIDIVGHSRGGYIALNLAYRLATMGCNCNGRRVSPLVRFIGLLDPVDMAIGYGETDDLSPNVRNAILIVPSAEVATRGGFRRPALHAFDRACNGKSGFIRRRVLFATHAAIGGWPWYNRSRKDIWGAIGSDRELRTAMRDAGSGVQVPDVGDYRYNFDRCSTDWTCDDPRSQGREKYHGK